MYITYLHAYLKMSHEYLHSISRDRVFLLTLDAELQPHSLGSALQMKGPTTSFTTIHQTVPPAVEKSPVGTSVGLSKYTVMYLSLEKSRPTPLVHQLVSLLMLHTKTYTRRLWKNAIQFACPKRGTKLQFTASPKLAT